MNTELNERIAIEVMGYQFSTPPGMVSNKWWRKLPDGYVDVCFDTLPNYSKYMQYAWLIVIELERRDIYLTLELSHHRAYATFTKENTAQYFIASPNAPLAIVWAALGIVAKLGSQSDQPDIVRE